MSCRKDGASAPRRPLAVGVIVSPAMMSPSSQPKRGTARRATAATKPTARDVGGYPVGFRRAAARFIASAISSFSTSTDAGLATKASILWVRAWRKFSSDK